MKESDTVVDAKLSLYSPTIDTNQSINNSKDGKYKQYINYNNEQNIQVDEYTNKQSIKGYTIRSYANKAGVDYVKVIDKGNGGFDTGGWVEIKNDSKIG